VSGLYEGKQPHRARKRFGQNFLRDSSVIDRIIATMAIRDDDHWLEIGPGQAALTLPLAAQLGAQGRLDLLELDRDLAQRLEQHFDGCDNVRVHSVDAMRFDYTQLGETPRRLCGNLPYNISTPLIFHLLAQVHRGRGATGNLIIRDMYFMLQKEVVERITAAPGSKAYGRLSVMTQYHCHTETLFDVPPNAFQPQPKVMSAVVKLQPHHQSDLSANDEEQLRTVVAAAFSQRRKTLRNTLKSIISGEALAALDIDPAARAETLSVAEFVKIANACS